MGRDGQPLTEREEGSEKKTDSQTNKQAKKKKKTTQTQREGRKTQTGRQRNRDRERRGPYYLNQPCTEP